MLYSKKNLKFNDACQLILSLLKTLYNTLKKTEERLKNTDKENNIPAKKPKLNDPGTTNDYGNRILEVL